MGRLWQSLILGKLNPVFEYLPVENMVFANQKEYYEAISRSTKAGSSAPFIDFMLQEICNTLKHHQENSITMPDVGINVGIKSEQFDKILSLIRQNPRVSVREMALVLKISSRQCERLISEMKAQGLIKREGANKNGSWVVLKQ